MKVLKYLVLIFATIALNSSSCNKPPGAEHVWRLWVSNQSKIRISFEVSNHYPDTSILFKYETLKGCPVNEKAAYDIDKPWEELFNELPSDTLSIFIFSYDTLQKYEWEKVKDDYNILKRFDLSYQDLADNKWVVTYK